MAASIRPMAVAGAGPANEGPSVPEAPWLDAAADVVVVEGPDAAAYLQGQLSQELRDLAVGQRRWSFVLEPGGKVAGLVRVHRTTEERYELATDAGSGAALLARIDRFRIRVRAETSLLPAAEGARVSEDLERARVVAGWPRIGAEIVLGETVPAETGLTAVAVNFRKGCYPGQELVERMDSRGAEPPRSLRRLTVAEGTEPGAPVHDASGAEVGVVTSVAGTAALAMVKRGADIGERVVHGRNS
jgi:tRNA-modifying protein YgfZ